jgi:hypothetical protein
VAGRGDDVANKAEVTVGAARDIAQAAARPRDGSSSQACSLVVVGGSVLILASFLIPYFEPPFGGVWYMTWLSGSTAACGVVALRRRERGPIASTGRICSVMAAGLCAFTIIFPYAYSWAAGILMPD